MKEDKDLGAGLIHQAIPDVAGTEPRPITEDVVCEHGTAMDVHCCNCHSGFLFDSTACVCECDDETN